MATFVFHTPQGTLQYELDDNLTTAEVRDALVERLRASGVAVAAWSDAIRLPAAPVISIDAGQRHDPGQCPAAFAGLDCCEWARRIQARVRERARSTSR